MRNRLITALALAMTAGLATPALAADVLDRVQVGVPGTPTRAFPQNLSVVLLAPQNHARACCYDFVSGAWNGPRYRADGRDFQNASRIDWNVEFVRGSASTASVARSAVSGGYPEVTSRPRKVRHVVGGRTVGTLKAFSVVTQQPAPGAKAEAAIAVDLGSRIKAVTLFDMSDPPADRSSAGALTVDGVPASAWNRRVADASLDALYVEGPLPPRRVKARAAGKRIKGSVIDSAGHPAGEAKVILQRRAGRGWRKVGSDNATTRGAFSLAARKPGRYRVLATLATTSARSKVLRIR